MRLSRWIPITLSALALTAGCTKPRTAVWIDLSRVTEDLGPTVLANTSAGQTIVVAPYSIGIDAVEPSPRGSSAIIDRRSEAIRLMDREFADLIRDLEENFRRIILMDAESEVAALRRSLSGSIRERADAAMEEISVLIRRDAPERARMIVRAALYVGWPKIRGYSEDELRRSWLLREWDAEGRRLHTLIAERELELSTQIESVLARSNSLNAEEAASLEQQVKEILQRADSRAKALVEDRIRQTNREKLPELLEGNGLERTRQPSESVPVGGTAIQLSRGDSIEKSNWVSLLEQKLDIFLRVRGYKLASGPAHAPDKTAEFIAWLKNP